jgi:tRNA G18 (ribose-2'-O)-methylase SpoU
MPSGRGRERLALVQRFRAARSDPQLVVLEGLHALKHALRFGAAIELAVSEDPAAAIALAQALAPDVVAMLRLMLQPVDPILFRELAPEPPATGVLAIARRPHAPIDFWERAEAPAVLLEEPAHLGNLGAVVRVAAAAGAAAVLVTGPLDPWHPRAVRTAAGLHFALPVLTLTELTPLPGPLFAFDPAGEPFDPRRLPKAAVLAFGSERRGLSDALRAQAAARVRLPMRAGVSSLNLATAVAAALYLARFFRSDQ